MADKILLMVSVILMLPHHVLACSVGDDCTWSWCNPSDLSEGPSLIRAHGYSKSVWSPNDVPGDNQFVFLADHCREWLIAVNPSYLNPKSSNHLSDIDSCNPPISTIDRQNGDLQSKPLYAGSSGEGDDTECCDATEVCYNNGNLEDSVPIMTYINLPNFHDGVDTSDPYGSSATVQHGVGGNDCTSRDRWFPVTCISFIHFAAIISSLLFIPSTESGANKMSLMVSIILMSFHHVSAGREYTIYVDEKRTVWAARDLCESYGHTLAIVTTTADREALGALLTAAGKPDESLWLGLSGETIDGPWFWEDGTDCDSDYPAKCIGVYGSSKDPQWMIREPNNGGLCAEMRPNAGAASVSDISCGASVYTACHVNPIYDIYVDTKRTYSEARELCESKGTTVATVTTSLERRLLGGLMNVAGKPDESVWIGLNVNETWYRQWFWADGTICQYQWPSCIGRSDLQQWGDPRWFSGQPDNAGNAEDCAEIKPNQGSLCVNDVPCGSSRYTACNRKILQPTTSNPTTTAFSTKPTLHPTTTVPTSYPTTVPSRVPTFNYYIYVDWRRTHSEAKELCESKNETLATVSTTAERRELGALLTAVGRPDESVWIGLNDNQIEGQWAWDDGSFCNSCIGVYGSSEDPQWIEGEPNNSGGDEDCTEMYPNRGAASVNDASCSGGLERYTACNRKTKYNIYLDKTRTHSEAKQLCESYGTTLATVTTTADREALGILLTAAGKQNEYLWIGLSDTIKEGEWSWDDGTVCDSSLCIGENQSSEDPRWSWGEPNNYPHTKDGEDCAEMRPNAGAASVNDESCDRSDHERYTACNILPTSNPTTAAPTKPTLNPTTAFPTVLTLNPTTVVPTNYPTTVNSDDKSIAGDVTLQLFQSFGISFFALTAVLLMAY